MFIYEKRLEYPIRIKNPNPKLAAAIISQYGGPDGELGASLRYLSQRFSMPYPELKGLLTDIGTEGSKGAGLLLGTTASLQQEGPLLRQEAQVDLHPSALADSHVVQKGSEERLAVCLTV